MSLRGSGSHDVLRRPSALLRAAPISPNVDFVHEFVPHERSGRSPSRPGLRVGVGTHELPQRSLGNAAIAQLARVNGGNRLFGNNLSDWGQRAAWGLTSQFSYRRGANGKATTTNVRYGSLSSGGFGTYMLADPLLTDGGPGSEPGTITNPMWQHLERRRTPGDKTYYVRGHLLNDKVHGPAVWENLTPLTNPANNASTESHLRRVETTVKQAVANKGRLVYRVQAAYGRSPLQMFRWLRHLFDWASGGDDFKDIRETVYAENYVPVALWCKAWLYDDHGYQRILVPETVIKQRQFAANGTDPDRYTVEARSGLRYDLANRPRLARQVLPTLLLTIVGGGSLGVAMRLLLSWSAQQGTTPEQMIIDNYFQPAPLIALWTPVLVGLGGALVEQYSNKNETPWTMKAPKAAKRPGAKKSD
jgi:hypothetical protein